MWFDIILVILFLVGNAIYITIGVKDITSLVKRSILLYIINLILLALGEYINPITSIFRIRLSISTSIYKWLKNIIIAKNIVYIIVALFF
jgi:hypothetical protein